MATPLASSWRIPACPSGKPHGFSLIELLLVLGVLALLMVAGFFIYKQVLLDNQIRQEHQRLDRTAALILELYPTSRVPINVNTLIPLMRKRNILPPLASEQYDVWGGPLQIDSMKNEAGGNWSCGREPLSVVFRLNSVPVAACSKLLASVLASPDRFCYAYILGTGQPQWMAGVSGYASVPTTSDLVQACQEASDAGYGEGLQVRIGFKP